MIYLVLFIAALYSWFKKDRATYYILLICLLFKCFNLVPPSTTLRSDDLALMAVLITSFSSFGAIEGSFEKNIKIFFAILAVIFVLSISYYGIPFIQVIKGCRHYLFILCVFDIRKMTRYDVSVFFKRLYLLSVALAAIYVIYIVTGASIPIYHDVYDEPMVKRSGFLGLARDYNWPVIVPYMFIYGFLVKKDCTRFQKYGLTVLGLCLLCIQSRGLIINIIIISIIGYVLQNRRNGSNLIIGLLFFLPVVYFAGDAIFSGETGQKTMTDFSYIFSGDVFNKEFELDQGDATFTYRMTLLVATFYKLNESSIVTLLFGVGMFVELPLQTISDLGLLMLAREAWDGYVIFTPDISYVNILCNFGLLGFFVYFRFFYCIAKDSHNQFRKGSDVAIFPLMLVLYQVLIGLDGSSITYPSALLLPLIANHYSNISYPIKNRC